MNQRVLVVDDEPKVLAALDRHFGEQFEITTAPGSIAALEVLNSSPPFAVVVSDMRMPEMNGITLLCEVRKRSPNTVRIMLTGCAEFQIAVNAVNEGNVFRFLPKPCQPEALTKAITAGIEQYRLITAEKELIEKTLSGSVKVLTDVLSLVNPAAFGKAARVRRIARTLAAEMQVEKAWTVNLAAMLSQIGCVTLPPGVMEKMHKRQVLSESETAMVQAHPGIGRDLVANIPRLELVAEIIGHQDARYVGKGRDEIPIGARILKVALDFDSLVISGMPGGDAIITMQGRHGCYDPQVLKHLEAVQSADDSYGVREVYIHELNNQMILAEDILATSGMLLVCRGSETTPELRSRLHNFLLHQQIKEPIRVLVKTESPEDDDKVNRAKASPQAAPVAV